ncbi:dual specificity protein phosphatase 22 isoform X4 [Microcebus murinus]|uniref:dual specificity protein phosphatase 22 isoform X4 n=1 Tax=Microcebus murinus TaxID=30608 RepID=UPI003F6CBF61
MGNGMSKILPGLYIGNFKDARDAEQLSKNKVTHILSVHDSARPMLEGVKYLCIPAADSPSQNLTRHFKESIKFIHECRLCGEGCLVHWTFCTHGIIQYAVFPAWLPLPHVKCLRFSHATAQETLLVMPERKRDPSYFPSITEGRMTTG